MKFNAAFFDTAFGRAGIAWGDAGLRAIAFPGLEREEDIARTLLRHASYAAPATPPLSVRGVIDGIVALFDGGNPDFSDTAFDFAGAPEFDCKVWGLTFAIPKGALRTYGDLAKDLGDVAQSRRVGQALGRNPFPVVIPCHRVIGANGTMTGFSAPGGAEAKRRLLKLEGALEPDLFD